MPPLLGMLLVGLAVGVIGGAVKPGGDTLGLIMTALVGVVGSFLASYVGVAMGWYQEGESLAWVAAALGAMTLLALFSLVKTR